MIALRNCCNPSMSLWPCWKPAHMPRCRVHSNKKRLLHPGIALCSLKAGWDSNKSCTLRVRSSHSIGVGFLHCSFSACWAHLTKKEQLTMGGYHNKQTYFALSARRAMQIYAPVLHDTATASSNFKPKSLIVQLLAYIVKQMRTLALCAAQAEKQQEAARHRPDADGSPDAEGLADSAQTENACNSRGEGNQSSSALLLRVYCRDPCYLPVCIC